VLYAHARKQAVLADAPDTRTALNEASETLARFFAAHVRASLNGEELRRNLGVQLPDVKPAVASATELACACDLHRALSAADGALTVAALEAAFKPDLAAAATRGRLARTITQVPSAPWPASPSHPDQVLHANGMRLHNSFVDAADHVKTLWEKPHEGLGNFLAQ
jgi:hypothetical protein